MQNCQEKMELIKPGKKIKRIRLPYTVGLSTVFHLLGFLILSFWSVAEIPQDSVKITVIKLETVQKMDEAPSPADPAPKQNINDPKFSRHPSQPIKADRVSFQAAQPTQKIATQKSGPPPKATFINKRTSQKIDARSIEASQRMGERSVQIRRKGKASEQHPVDLLPAKPEDSPVSIVVAKLKTAGKPANLRSRKVHSVFMADRLEKSTYESFNRPRTINSSGNLTPMKAKSLNFHPSTTPSQQVLSAASTGSARPNKKISGTVPPVPSSMGGFLMMNRPAGLVKFVDPSLNSGLPNPAHRAALAPEYFENDTRETKEGNSNPKISKPDPQAGKGDSSTQYLRGIRKGFSAQVWQKIASRKYYPRIARDRGYEGKPVIGFTLAADGELLKASLITPSEHKLLDQAALKAVKSASPYPPIPRALKLKSIRFQLPISFILEEQ